ncbi:FAD-dependent oxidoreductase [Bacillus aquiflavi]|uniref:FAD-dependent oxidoreductase n=2 Tax=Bacillus aquiflavi TaxID=2672567 RepID=A0A6B3W4P8_9BACI|nr:FAD-dependent oxidoreductase [Bacillus aquiflavi]NEY82916.1 FAD-dependent oxidoreductase [Bacillus aquiflavi]UAC50121.1 FAD-dependent oxidoreductase [Bacillus aquiflavi]
MTQFPQSYWTDSVNFKKFPALSENLEVDVAVVGGGITGITTAYLLIKEGLKVALIDAGSILNGTTGHTTAKITAQHGIIYDEIISHFGEEIARLYFQANNEALQFIRNIVKEKEIDCDFTDEDAYIYTNDSQSINKLINESNAYEKIGINGDLIESIPLDIPIKSALVMKNQAQFHPLKYLKVLVNEITENGGLIFEDTTAVDVDYSEKTLVKMRNGHHIACDYVAVCSHYPFYDGLGFYPTRMYSERSYLMAVKTKNPFPGGMYISAEDPKRSLRDTVINGEKILLVGGENHKTGQGISTIRHYEALRDFAQQTFGIETMLYRWSAQDLTTLDKIPYVGRITNEKENVLVATGYRKWGMTNSTAAAQIIRDIIVGKENPFIDVYTPSRFKADPSVKNFIKTNIDVAKHLIEGKLEYPLRTADELNHDEGSVVNVNGRRAGAYKDEKGQLYIVDTTCTHLGCELEWNSGDRTWDCPCHGSRFSIIGEVVEGPAEQPLKRIETK